MSGRSLSVSALAGSLATLVLVATMAGTRDTEPRREIRTPTPTPVLRSVDRPIQMPTSRAIYRFVREQGQPTGMMLASHKPTL